MVIAFKKFGKNEELINFVERMFSNRPSLATNVILLENKARAYMDLAKICINTGKSKKHSTKIKAKAWAEARNYLEKAEKDLHEALENATSFVEKGFLKQDTEFLEKMKKIAQKPKNKNSN